MDLEAQEMECLVVILRNIFLFPSKRYWLVVDLEK